MQPFEKSYILSTGAFFATALLVILSTGVPWVIVPAIIMGGVTVYLFLRSRRQRRDEYGK